MKKTYISGKDAALEDSISKIQLLLKNLGFDVEEVSWQNPLPNVWSVHLRDKDCPLLYSNGKGICKKAALASALGEFVERLTTNFFFSTYYLGKTSKYYPNEKFFSLKSKKYLSEKLREFYHFEKPENLIDISSRNLEKRICCIPFSCMKTNEKLFFPVNILNNLYVSNGMSAGNSNFEAQSQALSEIIERYVKNRIISEEISLPEIPKKILEKFPKVLKAIKKLDEKDFSILIHDASLGGVFPVINITLLNKKNGTAFVAFGAHPQFEVALERTLTELFQGRSLNQLNEFQPPSFDSETVAEHYNLENHFIDSTGLISWKFFNKKSDYDFKFWNFEGTTKQEIDYLSKIIYKLGFDIFKTEYNLDGIYCCRIIVPGMSEIYPVEDLVWNNRNEGVFFRDDILNLKNLNKTQLKKLLKKIEKSGAGDHQLVCELIGIAPDTNSDWEDFRISELKGLVALALEDLETALECINWTLLFGQISEEKMIRYRCLTTILEMELSKELKISDYKKNLSKLYNLDILKFCQKIISGKNVFSKLKPSFNFHKKLIKAHRKINF